MTTPIPIACTLDEADLPERGAEMARLGESLIAVQADSGRALLRFPLEMRAEVETFVAAESTCCPFFAFEQSERNGDVELRVSAPEDGKWAVRGLVAGFVAGWGGLV